MCFVDLGYTNEIDLTSVVAELPLLRRFSNDNVTEGKQHYELPGWLWRSEMWRAYLLRCQLEKLKMTRGHDSCELPMNQGDDAKTDVVEQPLGSASRSRKRGGGENFFSANTGWMSDRISRQKIMLQYQTWKYLTGDLARRCEELSCRQLVAAGESDDGD